MMRLRSLSRNGSPSASGEDVSSTSRKSRRFTLPLIRSRGESPAPPTSNGAAESSSLSAPAACSHCGASSPTNKTLEQLVQLTGGLKEQIACSQAMLTNERRRRHNEKRKDWKGMKPLVKEKPGSGRDLARRTLGIDLPPSADEEAPQVGDEFPSIRYPDDRANVTIRGLADLMSFYNDDFGIGADDWGRDAFARRFVEWLKV